MKKSLVLAMAMALGVTASAYAANPFSDVPAGHWAYDSINKLAAAGVIEGYGDSTFGGDKLMTRYEMAQIVAKAMAKGAINDDWTYSAMFRNQQFFTGEDANKGEEDVAFQRAYVNGRVGGLAVQAGRYNKTDITGGNIHDNRMDGVQVSYGKDVKLTAGYGKATGVKALDNENKDFAYAELNGKLGAVDAYAAYYKFDNVKKTADDDKIWTVGLGFDLAKDLKLSGSYIKSDYDKAGVDDDGYVATLAYKGAKAAKAGSWGLSATYYDQGMGTVIAHTMDGVYFDEGFKGYSVGANYTLAKNIVAGVTYYDLETKEAGKDTDAQTLWSQVVFSF